MYRFIRAAAIVLCLAALAGCASKAKAIKTGAATFSAESLKSINLLSDIVDREAQETLTTQSTIEKDFINQLMYPGTALNRQAVARLMDPFKNREDQVKNLWTDYIQELRTTYTQFGTMFQSLDKGSMFASKSVRQSIPLTKKLTANMVALGKHWSHNPARFDSDFTTLLSRLDDIRSSDESEALKELRMQIVYNSLRDLMNTEDEMTESLVKQSCQAARVGQALTSMLENYNHLSVDDINDLLVLVGRLGILAQGTRADKYALVVERMAKEISSDQDGETYLNQALDSLGHIQRPQ